MADGKSNDAQVKIVETALDMYIKSIQRSINSAGGAGGIAEAYKAQLKAVQAVKAVL